MYRRTRHPYLCFQLLDVSCSDLLRLKGGFSVLDCRCAGSAGAVTHVAVSPNACQKQETKGTTQFNSVMIYMATRRDPQYLRRPGWLSARLTRLRSSNIEPPNLHRCNHCAKTCVAVGVIAVQPGSSRERTTLRNAITSFSPAPPPSPTHTPSVCIRHDYT
jgi:hypothetical protein